MSFNFFCSPFLFSAGQQEGIRLTIESFSHLRKELAVASFTDFTEESKVDKLLGGGRGSNILSLMYLVSFSIPTLLKQLE